ncbi:MAG: hypothetical protein IJM79_06805 [Erysipelotrichaceae bacterium]|nr:hypothetical protein [Erysipelotrichaceae bacterium]
MDALEDYLEALRSEYENMTVKRAADTLLSDLNYQNRSQLKSCRGFGFIVRPGDICYIDFGKAYKQEAGYQHFGLVLNVFDAKALVIPMTSSFNAFRKAYDPLYNPEGVRHLMRLGKIEGLYRYSILFLNDGKFINTARIIDIKAHLDTQSRLFQQIRERFIACIQEEN